MRAGGLGLVCGEFVSVVRLAWAWPGVVGMFLRVVMCKPLPESSWTLVEVT